MVTLSDQLKGLLYLYENHEDATILFNRTDELFEALVS